MGRNEPESIEQLQSQQQRGISKAARLARWFFALHTWQYEAIASPQGVCSAYPPVLFFLAERLQSLAQSAPANPLSDKLERFLPQPSTCEACQLMITTEQQKARDSVEMCSGADGDIPGRLPLLCVHHVHSVLLVTPSLEIGQLLVQEQVRVLRRLGEDMQRYSLKHEALRRHLASGEQEHRAYEAGLSRLVELRSIVAPRKID